MKTKKYSKKYLLEDRVIQSFAQQPLELQNELPNYKCLDKNKYEFCLNCDGYGRNKCKNVEDCYRNKEKSQNE